MSVLWLLLGLLALTGECVSFSQMTLEMEGFAQGPSGTRIHEPAVEMLFFLSCPPAPREE